MNVISRMSRFTSICALLVLQFGFGTAASAQTFIDNSFTGGWATSLYYQAPATPTLSATASHFPTSLPNRRRLTHSYFTGTNLYATHLNSLHTYTPTSGQIVSIRFRYTIRAITINVGYAPLIAQGGHYYSRSFDSATTAGSTITHNLQASDFHLVRPDGRLDTDRHPDFSCAGQPVTLGYYTGNSNPYPPPTTSIVSVSDLSAWQVDLTTEPCQAPANLCCPPWSTPAMMQQLRLQQPGWIPTVYTFRFFPTPPFQTQMQTYVDYLHALIPAVTTLIVDWTITNQGTGVLPATAPGPTVSTASNNWTCSATGCPGASTNATFSSLVLVPNTWYRVRTTLRLNTGPGPWPANCRETVFHYNMREIP